MKTIALQANLDKPGVPEKTRELAAWLLKERRTVVAPMELRAVVPDGTILLPDENFVRDAELLIVLGGDGTLLQAARVAYRYRIPILGVNFGRLGFLTDVNVDEMLPAIAQVLRGDYRMQPRLMIRAEVLDSDGEVQETAIGLNDCIVREVAGRSIAIRTSISGTPLSSFRGDGLIVSTPTGSTAYSLSAGGPVVEPSLQALMATAICPHTFSVRPILFPSQEAIEVGFSGRGNHVALFVDGQFVIDLSEDQRVRVRRTQRRIHFILVGNRSFYEVLQSKLHWGGV